MAASRPKWSSSGAAPLLLFFRRFFEDPPLRCGADDARDDDDDRPDRDDRDDRADGRRDDPRLLASSSSGGVGVTPDDASHATGVVAAPGSAALSPPRSTRTSEVRVASLESSYVAIVRVGSHRSADWRAVVSRTKDFGASGAASLSDVSLSLTPEAARARRNGCAARRCASLPGVYVDALASLIERVQGPRALDDALPS